MVDSRTFKPRKVVVLLVGEAAPADGPSFYGASGNLFAATHEAFAAALGSDVPSGESFLRSFAARGGWQVNASDCNLPELIAQSRPQIVVAVKSSLAGLVARAIDESGIRTPPAVTVVRYPIRQWRAEYVAKLAEIVAAQGP